MSLAERLGRATDRFYDRMRSPQAAHVTDAAPTGDLGEVRGHKYCVVVTYKRNGEGVPSPVWFGTGDGKLYFQTGASSVKVTRIKRNPAVRVAPTTSRGRPLDAPFVATARVLESADERARAESCLRANYGLGRWLYSRFGDRLASVYIEVTPTPNPTL
jgi:PPOX class probable F420-dependent enzyme